MNFDYLKLIALTAALTLAACDDSGSGGFSSPASDSSTGTDEPVNLEDALEEQADELDQQAETDPNAIGIPSGTYLSLLADKPVVGAFSGTGTDEAGDGDCSTSGHTFAESKVQLIVKIADRLGATAGLEGQRVYMIADYAGRLTSVTDPALVFSYPYRYCDIAIDNGEASCSINWIIEHPRNVDTNTAGRCVSNIVAFMVGEEGFFDGANDVIDGTAKPKNNVFDDADDHSTIPQGNWTAKFDQSEPVLFDVANNIVTFVDIDKNGQFDAANGLWDGPSNACTRTLADGQCANNGTTVIWTTIQLLLD